MEANEGILKRGGTMDAEPLGANNYAFLAKYVQEATGIALGQDKLYLLESRLNPLLRDERLRSLGELCGRLRKGVPEAMRRRIAECMTTHETLFFRDPAVFEGFKTEILPRMARQQESTRTLRVWCAACSSGQEPYSLAMLLLEAGYGNWKIDILGTDLSSRILDRAKAGRFLQIEINRGLPAPLLVKYFERAGLDWQIKDEVRRLVRFAPLDLRQNLRAMGPFDIVFCRNVLIYFDLPTRQTILTGIRETLTAEGYLLLGASETTFNMEAGLSRVAIRNSIAYQKNPIGART